MKRWVLSGRWRVLVDRTEQMRMDELGSVRVRELVGTQRKSADNECQVVAGGAIGFTRGPGFASAPVTERPNTKQRD